MNIRWKDLKNLVDLPENRDKGMKCRLMGMKDQIVKLGGVRIVLFYFGRYELWIWVSCSLLGIWGSLYFLMRYNWLEMDKLIDLMSRLELTSRGISVVESHPDVKV